MVTQSCLRPIGVYRRRWNQDGEQSECACRGLAQVAGFFIGLQSSTMGVCDAFEGVCFVKGRFDLAYDFQGLGMVDTGFVRSARGGHQIAEMVVGFGESIG
jgi:hypothetical protein